MLIYLASLLILSYLSIVLDFEEIPFMQVKTLCYMVDLIVFFIPFFTLSNKNFFKENLKHLVKILNRKRDLVNLYFRDIFGLF